MAPAPEPADLIRTTSVELLERARGGDRDAMETLFGRVFPPLRRWAHGRLPSWARTISDTADLVQEALFSTFRRIDKVEVRRRGALQAYLQQAVKNRVRDALRGTARAAPPEPLDRETADDRPSPLELAMEAELRGRYLAALARLRSDDQRLIVGRIDLAYSYEQLALATGRRGAEAARIAARRAMVRLANEMSP